MRTKTATWFICGVRHNETMEDGSEKKITEHFVIDALSFMEAEERVIEKLPLYINGEFDVKTCAFAPFSEIFFCEEDANELWYKAKIAYITIDEKSGKEKRSNVNYLVQANSIAGALNNIASVMKNSMLNYVILSIQQTTITEVIEYND